MNMANVTLEVLTSPGCAHCRAFVEYWHTIEKDWPNVTFQDVSILSKEGQDMAQKFMIFASPGIVLNGELWATGGFDKSKFLEKLQTISA